MNDAATSIAGRTAAVRRRSALPLLATMIAAAFAGCGGGEILRVGVGGDVTAQHRPAPPETEEGGHLRAWLWEVRGSGAPEPSYVLGTMHIGVTRRRALPPPLDEHLHHSRVLVMEIDFREAERMFQAATSRPLPRRQWLDRALPSSAWRLLVEELGHLVPPDVLRRIPPGFLAMHLMQVRMAEVEAREDGREPVRGAASTARLDSAIFEWSVTMGRPLVALETPEQQMAALARIPSGPSIDTLRALLVDADAARDEARALREAYLSFDAQRLSSALGEMSEEERRILLTERNIEWMERLVPELERGRAFVAVGLGHLLGEQSVLAMLAERGFTVRRIGQPQSALP